MIVPRNRLLFWISMVLPFAALGAMVPSATVLSLGLIGGLVLVAIVDAALTQGALHGIRIEFAPVVRLSKGREGIIPLWILNEGKQQKWLRLGLPLPQEIYSPNEDLYITPPPPSSRARITWPCTPTKRGNFYLNRCYLETSSPLGLWNIRAFAASNSEIRVYPNLLEERRHLAALFLNRGNFGLHLQRMVGQGREFEKLREYIPGDSYDQIHWKATAKRGRPVTKIFQIERTQEVYVIIDFSRLSRKKVGVETALERFITAALVMGLVAEQQGDLFGLLTFSDRVRGFVRAKNGKDHYHACRNILYTLYPEMVSPDFNDICSFIRLRLRRRALLIFLTDLDDPVLTENLTRNMDLICRQHLILVGMLKSKEAGPLFSDSSVASVDEIYQRLTGHIQWHRVQELSQAFQRRGVRLLQLDDEKMTTQLITQYLAIKQRQLL